MEFHEGAAVYTAQGDKIGSVDRVIMDPRTKRITHIVVRKGFLFSEDRVVPVEWITSASSDEVITQREKSDFETLPPFEEAHYRPVADGDLEPGGPDEGERLAHTMYWYPTIAAPVADYPSDADEPLHNYVRQTEQNIPEGTVAMDNGAEVFSSDGQHVGNIDRFFTAPDSNRITHFVISDGLLFKHRKLIPVEWVKTAIENQVRLSVDSAFLERVEPYEAD